MADVPKHAVITGAAGGIGRALVRAFGEAGYVVVATDRVEAPEGLPCARYVTADLERTVQDEIYAEQVFADIRAPLVGGALHALVNNAAVQITGGVDGLTRRDWQRTLDVNLLAPFLWTQALLPALQAARGCVVNVSSIHARLTKPGFVAYATGKAALSGLTRALAVDVGPRVRVNAIEPAAIDTAMLRDGFGGDVDGLARLAACHPAGRIGAPEEVAALALALCDSRLVFLSGACVALDGSVGARLHDPA